MQLLKKILFILLLASLGFLFAHSEMNFLSHFDSDNHCHQAHDYCELIKDAKVERTNLTQENTIIVYASILDRSQLNYLNISDIFLKEEYCVKKKLINNPTYLTNQIFLI
jgi:hypothetical protein